MFRLLLVTTLVLTLSLGWLHKKGDIPQSVRTIEAILHPVFHKEEVYRYAEQYKIDPLLVLALIKAESHFFKKAKSSRGAVGLMQLLPSTAREVAKELGLKNFKNESLEDSETNIRIGTYYLAKLHKEFGNDSLLALAAYNAGKKNVRDWQKLHQKKSLVLEELEFSETRKFAQNVLLTRKQLVKLKEIRAKIFNKFIAKYEKPSR